MNTGKQLELKYDLALIQALVAEKVGDYHDIEAHVYLEGHQMCMKLILDQGVWVVLFNRK